MTKTIELITLLSLSLLVWIPLNKKWIFWSWFPIAKNYMRTLLTVFWLKWLSAVPIPNPSCLCLSLKRTLSWVSSLMKVSESMAGWDTSCKTSMTSFLSLVRSRFVFPMELNSFNAVFKFLLRFRGSSRQLAWGLSLLDPWSIKSGFRFCSVFRELNSLCISSKVLIFKRDFKAYWVSCSWTSLMIGRSWDSSGSCYW